MLLEKLAFYFPISARQGIPNAGAQCQQSVSNRNKHETSIYS